MRLRHLAVPFLLALAPSAFAAPYEISADGQEVTDAATGLIWRRCAEGMQWNGKECAGDALTTAFDKAVAHAKSQAAGGKSWRLPTVTELRSLFDKSQPMPPMVDPKAFPNMPNMQYWSSQVAKEPHRAHFVVYHGNGASYDEVKGMPFHVRLVRNK